MLARGDPVSLGGWVNLEHVRTCAEDGLLPVWREDPQWAPSTLQGAESQAGRGRGSPGCGHWSGWTGWAPRGNQKGGRSCWFSLWGKRRLSVPQDWLREAKQVQPQDPLQSAPFIELHRKGEGISRSLRARTPDFPSGVASATPWAGDGFLRGARWPLTSQHKPLIILVPGSPVKPPQSPGAPRWPRPAPLQYFPTHSPKAPHTRASSKKWGTIRCLLGNQFPLAPEKALSTPTLGHRHRLSQSPNPQGISILVKRQDAAPKDHPGAHCQIAHHHSLPMPWGVGWDPGLGDGLRILFAGSLFTAPQKPGTAARGDFLTLPLRAQTCMG